MKVVAVIPCYNERYTIAEVVREAKSHVDEVVVADDNSDDNTAEFAEEAGARVIKNTTIRRGTGYNTKRGLDGVSNADIVVTLDGDGQHIADEIPRVLESMLSNDADLVIGSRFMQECRITGYRKFGIDVITWLYNFGHKTKVVDTQSGFRAYTRRLLDILTIEERGFGFSTEVLIKARTRGFKILEVPITCVYHVRGSNMNSIQHGLGVALVTIRWRLREELQVRYILFAALKIAARLLAGRGLKLRLLRKLYSVLTQKLTPERDRVVCINDCLIDIGKRGLDGVTATMVASHSYEPLTTEVVKSLLRKDMNVVDIGANIGYYTLLASKLVKNTGRVWAIEPEPTNFSLLQKNIKLNQLHNVVLVNKAISNTNRTAKLYVSHEESGEHSLIRGRSHIKNSIEVDATTLDDLIGCERVDLVKNDCEGSEIDVLRGAERTIMSNTGIMLVIEVWFPGIKASGSEPINLWELLRRYGFEHFCVLDEIGKQTFVGDWRSTYEKVAERCDSEKFSVNLLCSRNPLRR